MKTKTRGLSLDIETLRELTLEDAQQVNGGNGGAVVSSAVLPGGGGGVVVSSAVLPGGGGVVVSSAVPGGGGTGGVAVHRKHHRRHH